jgi:hypothetical protein
MNRIAQFAYTARRAQKAGSSGQPRSAARSQAAILVLVASAVAAGWFVCYLMSTDSELGAMGTLMAMAVVFPILWGRLLARQRSKDLRRKMLRHRLLEQLVTDGTAGARVGEPGEILILPPGSRFTSLPHAFQSGDIDEPREIQRREYVM